MAFVPVSRNCSPFFLFSFPLFSQATILFCWTSGSARESMRSYRQPGEKKNEKKRKRVFLFLEWGSIGKKKGGVLYSFPFFSNKKKKRMGWGKGEKGKKGGLWRKGEKQTPPPFFFEFFYCSGVSSFFLLFSCLFFLFPLWVV